MTRRLYAIRGGEYVKLGLAGNPARRLRELQTGSPETLQLEWSLDLASVCAREFERHVHNQLRNHRARGEWFHLSPGQLEIVKDLIEVMLEKCQ